MNLAEIHQERTKRKIWPCRIRTILGGLDERNRSWLEATLADKGVSHTAIAGTLKEAEIPASDNAVARHRSLTCSCRELAHD